MDIKEFHSIRISLASPDEIRSWSHGEVTKPETINYRRLRAEKDGLFCEAIFGPTKDWQCYCGKYKKIRYRGIICDKCGVEVTRARVRRERMAHIELASPVAHIWYTRRVPSYLGILLDISRRNLDRVLYFAQYIVTKVDEDERERAIKLLEEEHSTRLEVIRDEGDENAKEARAEAKVALESFEALAGEERSAAAAELDVQTSALMTAAAEMQESLNELRGKKARKKIVFEPTGTTLAMRGDRIEDEAYDRLNEVLQARLSDMQAEAEDQARELEASLAMRRDELSALASGQGNMGNESEIAEAESELSTRLDEIRSIEVMQLLTEAEYWDLKEAFPIVFEAGMGAEALFDIVTNMDLAQVAAEMRDEIMYGRSKQRRKKSTKRLKVVEALRRSSNRAQWMILEVLPVIPPDLRPMVQLDGGRFATSDLNDLYRRVINRNNRLRRLLELGAPDVIIRNEKRMLQEAVDSLIDNSRRGKAVSARGRRKLKSLSDMLKGKQGRFRRNLLGKRVDYSGRSVIVIGPQLKLDQCGLPKTMALELFRPFVMRKLVEYNYAHNVKGAKRLIEKMDPVVWEVLEEIIIDYPVLLNRAPTLHRLGIQAFQPVLVEGKAIQIHPLVCAAFNADFDGDMMAVHVPLSEKAKREARELMLASRNLLKPSSGEPIVEPQKDMVLGMYYMTIARDKALGAGRAFGSLEEVDLAYALGQVHLHAAIVLRTETYYDEDKVRYADGKARVRMVNTTVGRAIFNSHIPEHVRFYDPGTPMGKSEVKDLVAEIYDELGPAETAEAVDRMKQVGFEFATRSGLSIAVDDIVVPARKKEIIAEADETVLELQRQFRRGLITDDERYRRTIEVWNRVTDVLTDAVRDELPEFGSIRLMAASGSTKGGFNPIRQLAGMRGLMSDPSGRIIDLPIRSNFREGLSTLEYFISTHGARKGLADTALRTADAGYLTRRLVDVAQDAIINDTKCDTTRGIAIGPRTDPVMAEPIGSRLVGRMAQGAVADPNTGEVIVKDGVLMDEVDAARVQDAGVTEVVVRSPLTCELRHGICQACYGRDLARGGVVNIGEAVGIIAAQSIGEPGTQLTLRTFHTGGVAAGGGDITHGLPRVQELFEARNPKGEALLTDISGRVRLHQEGEILTLTVADSQMIADEYVLEKGWRRKVKPGDEVKAGEELATPPKAEEDNQRLVAENDGIVDIDDRTILVRREHRREEEYIVPAGAHLLVDDGGMVEAGQQMTEGPKNPYRILEIQGVHATQTYLLDEIQKVYRSQGVAISDKHIEIIVRQMLCRVRILRPGDTGLLPGDFIERMQIEEMNTSMADQNRKTATYQPMLLGITKASLSTESLLSAASFQHTINVLAEAAIQGKTDYLIGLKENVIIGKLIPAGTGFERRSVPEDKKVAIAGGGGELDLSDALLAELFEDDIDIERIAIDEDTLDPLTASTAAATDDVADEAQPDDDEEDSLDVGDDREDDEVEDEDEDEDEDVIEEEDEAFDGDDPSDEDDDDD